MQPASLWLALFALGWSSTAGWAQSPPRILTQPANVTVAVGGQATFSVTASGDEPLTYRWYWDVIFEVIGETNATLTLTNVEFTDAGTYQVVVENALGVASSVEATLAVKVPPLIVQPPASQVTTQGQSVTFTVQATGDAPLNYQWFFNETNAIPGASQPVYSIANVVSGQAGLYSVLVSNEVGRASTPGVVLTVRRPPAIVQPPVSLVRTQGSTAVFNVVAEGDQPLTFQWFARNAIVPGATSDSLVIDPVAPADDGDFRVIVSNELGTATSAVARLTVMFSPSIVQPPASLVTTQGQTVTLIAVVNGSAPLNLQWRRNGVALPGQTNASLILNSVGGTDSGDYSLVASNDVGLVESIPANLLVRIPPRILQQPTDLVLVPAGTGVLQVSADGDQPLQYQWWFNETNALPGGTGTTWPLANVTPAVEGRYSVSISNEVGATMSRQALVRLKALPGIAQQPVSLVLTQGQAAFFSVLATGDGPFVYQWFFNGTNQLAGATNSSLVYFNTQASRAGRYSVRVRNEVGEIISDAAELAVRIPPSIVQNVLNLVVAPGGTATFLVVAAGDAPLAYQWFFNQTNPLLDATNSTLTLSNAQPADSGRYSVVISNHAGVVTSRLAELRLRFPPVITVDPSSVIVTQGATATFTVAVSGDGPLTFRWFQQGTNLVSTSFSPTLTLSNVQPAQAGVYSVLVSNLVGLALSSDAFLTVREVPTFVKQPGGGTVALGASFTFDVVAKGEEAIVYQWFFNGDPLNGAVGRSLSVSNITIANAGSYSVVASNVVGTATSINALLVVKRLPVIVQSPASQTVTQDMAAAFTVTAGGDGPFHYQWLRNGSNPMAGDAPTLLIPVTSAADAGDYSVIVSNDVGSATSLAGNLVVLLKPHFLQQPVSMVATQGSFVELSVSVASDLPPGYAWRKDGVELPGATTATLALSHVQPTDSASYSVVVRNDYGAVTSQVAVLVVRGLDFGDAPDPGFPTLLINDGARHVILPGVYLGTGVDAEPDGQPGPVANRDDNPAFPAEAGVAPLSVLRPGQPCPWRIIASTNGVLNAWVDGNLNGAWEHPAEQFLTDRNLNSGTNLLTLTLPSSTKPGSTMARFRFSSVGGLLPIGLAADGEVEDYILAVLPSSDLRLGQTASATRVAAGANVTFTIGITNAGPSDATAVALTAPISPRATLVSSVPSGGNCSLAAGVVSCQLGTLPPGGIASVALTIRTGSGTNQSVVTVAASEFDPNPADNTSVRSVLGIVSPPAYANGEAVLLPELDSGPGSIYPLSIIVAGLTSRIDKAVVTLHNVTHFWPDDLDVLLVGPAGQRLLLMSDCGLDNTISDATLSFDDDAASSLPNSDPPITSGTYKPTNFDRLSDNFVPPAPPEPYGTNLSVFKGQSANGTWSLYVMDDSPENLGYIIDGWSLSLTLADPLADVGLVASGAPSSVIVGNSVRYSIAVTNAGPSQSPTSIQHELPPGFQFVGASASRGSCTNTGGVVSCNFGNLAVGGTASATIDLSPTLGGTFTNRFSAITTQFDPNPSDNVAGVVTTVIPVADVAIARIDAPTSVLLGQVTTLAVTVTNRGPNPSTRVMLTNTLPGALAFLSATGAAAGCLPAGGTVLCDFGVLTSAQSATAMILTRATALGAATNVAIAAGPELDFVPNNNAATRVVQVVPAADVVVRTLSKRSEVVLEQTFVMDYSVSNAGPSATSVLLTNTVSAGMTIVSASVAGGNCTNVAGNIGCGLGTLPPGGNVTVSVSMRGLALGPMSSVVGVAGVWPDPAPGNNAVTNDVSIIPGADLALTLIESANPVWLGETVNYQLRLTNLGPVTATSVLVTNRLPPGISFIGMTASAGVCSHNAGIINCEIPSLARGAGALFSINGRGLLPGPGTNAVSVTAAEFDPDLANNSVRSASRVIASSGVFSLSSGVTIPDFGPAAPSPSTIFVSGLTAAVYRVRVTLTNLTHSYPDDLDMLLVGPGGQSTYLMSDVGGEFPVNNAVVLFDDAALAVGDSSPISTGTVRPTNFDLADVFPEPAPAGGHATNLTVFANTDPNGLWSLYIVDDASKDRGSLAGWSLNFATVDPIADLRLTPTLSANPVAVGSSFAITLLVTNAGPATATDVRMTNLLDAALSGISFATSQGGCTFAVRQLVCAFGNIPKDGTVEVVLSGTPAAAQLVANVATVSARETDLRPADNTRVVQLDFAEPPVIVVQPISQTVSNGVPVRLEAQVAGSAPLALQWFRNGQPVPGANAAVLTFDSPTPLNAGLYRLQASNRVGVALSAPANLMVIGPPTFSDLAPILTDEDVPTPEIPFTIFDFETPAELIEVTAVSSRPELVAPNGIFLSGSGSNRTVRIVPQPNAFGSLTIFLSARDADGGVTTLPVPTTVRSVNDQPTVTVFANQEVAEDEVLLLPFGAEDLETAAELLVLTITSSDERVANAAGAVFESTGASRVLHLTPVANASGTSVVAVVVTDVGGLSASNTFLLVVHPVNDPPTLDEIADQVLAEDSGAHAVALMGITSGASNELQHLQVAAVSSNPGVIAPPAVAYESAATSGTLMLTPVADATGIAVITVTVTDGAATNYLFARTFTVEVVPVSDAPQISPIAGVSTPEDIPIAVPFTISDPDSVGGLALAAASADISLVPAGGLVFSGTGGNRTLTITPAPDRVGTTSIRIIVTDSDGLSATNEFSLTVTPANGRPTLAALSDLTVREDAGPTPVVLTGIGSGAAGQAPTIVVTASSSSAALIPTPSISYISPAATGTLTFTPAANAVGSAVITVTVDNGQPENGTFSRRFTVTVTGTNDAPTLSAIGPQTMPEDGTNAVALTIGDAETPADLLALSASSSNPTLIAATNITFSGGGSNRFVVLAPHPELSGNAIITVRASDGVASNQITFNLTVTLVNDQPTLDPLNNLNVQISPGVVSVPLTGISSGATNENQTLVVSASTTNPSFFLNQPSVGYSSPNPTGTLSFRPVNNNSGSAVINVTVTDGGGGNALITRSFVLTVRPSANVLPTISLIGPQTINEDAVPGAIAFTVRDAETAAASLTVTAFSTNPQLIPDGNLQLGGAGTGNRTISFTPSPNQSGTGSIVLTVTDASFGSSNLTFGVTVNAVNDAPTLSLIPAQTVFEDEPTAFLPFTVSDVETIPAQLIVTASSSAPQLIPNNRIELGGSGSIRTVRVTPLPEQIGVATITVRVSDGPATNSTTFSVTVVSTNDAPILSPLANVTIDEDTVSTLVPFTVFDADNDADTLVYAADSSEPALVDSTGLVFRGQGTNRTMTITPKADQFGTAIITVTASDGSSSASSVFELTVRPINDPPVIGALAGQVVGADGRAHAVAISGIGSGAANEVQLVAISASVDQPALLSNLRVEHVVGATEGQLTFVPALGAVGTATITVTANDGQSANNLATRSFTVTLNQPPAIAYLPDVETDEDNAVGPIPVHLEDPDGTVAIVELSGIASDPVLVPAGGIVFSGTGATRQLTVTPGTNQAGATRLFLVATDALGAKATNAFFLTVRPVVDPIEIIAQPLDVVALVGTSPAFSVLATSVLPLSYQWQFEGTDVAGATNPLLQLLTVNHEQVGVYRVVVRSVDTSVVSRSARLSVVTGAPPPVITSIERIPGGAVVGFESTLGATYTLEYKNSLADGAWLPLGSTPGNGVTQTIADPTIVLATRFYRVRLD